MTISDEAKQAARTVRHEQILRIQEQAVKDFTDAHHNPIVRQLNAELDRLTRLNAELREYAHHESVCGFWLEDSICSCGLAQLLEKMK